MAIELDGVWWLEVHEVVELEGLSRRHVYRRMDAWTPPNGPATADQYYVWRDRSDPRFQIQNSTGKPEQSKAATRGRLIDFRYLSIDAQERWKQRIFKAVADGEFAAPSLPKQALNRATSVAPPATGPASSAKGQLDMFEPETDYERKLREKITLLKASVGSPQAAACLQRFKIIEPLHNHDWMARNEKNFTALLTRISHHVIHGTIGKHYWEGAGDFRGSQVVLIQGGRKWGWGRVIRKDLRAEIGTRAPMDIFCDEAPAHPRFHARKGTARS